VPLLLRAYQLWRELEAASGERLLQITGGMMLGHAQSRVITGSLASRRHWDLPFRELTAAEVHREFPAFDPPSDLVVVVEPEAGFLRPEAAITCHLRGAAQAGARLHFGERAVAWAPTRDGVEVRTGADAYSVHRLVLTAGAWTGAMLRGWGLPLRVERQVMVWL
ncbi:N-methyltryptophan oxidase, partial [mine drainage metagenome]